MDNSCKSTGNILLSFQEAHVQSFLNTQFARDDSRQVWLERCRRDVITCDMVRSYDINTEGHCCIIYSHYQVTL